MNETERLTATNLLLVAEKRKSVVEGRGDANQRHTNVVAGISPIRLYFNKTLG